MKITHTKLPIGLHMVVAGKKGALLTVLYGPDSGMLTTIYTSSTGTRTRRWRRPNHERQRGR